MERGNKDMKKKRIIIAICMIALGTALLLLSLTACGKNKEDRVDTYEVSDPFTSIYIDTTEADVSFIPTDSETASVSIKNDKKNIYHTVSVDNGTLKIELSGKKKLYDYVNLDFKEKEINVYLPEREYGALTVKGDTCDVDIPNTFSFTSVDVKVDTGDTECAASVSDFIKIDASTGDVDIENCSPNSISVSVSTGDVELEECTAQSISVKTSTGDIEASRLNVSGELTTKVSTGKISLSDVNCSSFSSNGSTGNITLTRFVASALIDIERSTGNVTLKDSDAGELLIETDTGDVALELRTEKVFIVRTDTGKINVPESVTGGKCKVTTDTGDVRAYYK